MIEKLEKSGAQFAKVVMKQYGIDIKLVKGGSGWRGRGWTLWFVEC